MPSKDGSTIILSDDSESEKTKESSPEVQFLGTFPAKRSASATERVVESIGPADVSPACSSASSAASERPGPKKERKRVRKEDDGPVRTSRLLATPDSSLPGEPGRKDIEAVIEHFGLKDAEYGYEEDFLILSRATLLSAVRWKYQLSFNLLPHLPTGVKKFSVRVHSNTTEQLTDLTQFPPIRVQLLFRSEMIKPASIDLSAAWLDDLLVKMIGKEAVRRLVFTPVVDLLTWLESNLLRYLNIPPPTSPLEYVPVVHNYDPRLAGPGFIRVAQVDLVLQAFLKANTVKQNDADRQDKFICVCGDEKDMKEAVLFQDCGHTFCKECVQVEMKSKIRKGLVKELTCLADDCCTVPSSQMVKDVVDKETFNRYCDHAAQAFVSDNETMVRCPKCPSAMELPPNVARPGTVRCPCGHQFCSDCLAHPHPTHPCMMSFNSTKAPLSEKEKQSVVDGFLRHLADRQWTINAHQRTVLAEGQTGFGLLQLVEPYLDSLVKTIQLDEPYLSSKTQMGRLVEFFGVVMRRAPFLESIKLKTCPCKKEEARAAQAEQLDKIKISLAKRSVALEITYVKGLHDREVRSDNGWIIKIGRGLDFHKASTNKNSIDEMESSFRQCRATIVDAIFKPLS